MPRSEWWCTISMEFLLLFLRLSFPRNQWWRREMSAVFSGYHTCSKINVLFLTWYERRQIIVRSCNWYPLEGLPFRLSFGYKNKFCFFFFFRVFRELMVSTLCFHDDEDTVNKLKLLFSDWMKTNGYVWSSKSLCEHFKIFFVQNLCFIAVINNATHDQNDGHTGPGEYSGFQVTGMIEWGWKWKPPEKP